MKGISMITARRLPVMPSVGELLRLYKIRAMKRLSQNFLLDPRLTDKIVNAAGRIDGGLVCEVGPGPGGITRSVLNKSPKHVVLVEKDLRFKPMLDTLQEAVSDWCRVDSVYADIMDFDMGSLVLDESFRREWEEPPPNIHVIGNLPFDVSTILIVKWLEDISKRENIWGMGRAKMTLTFQKEVARRIVAPILTRERCRMSIMCQNWCEPEHRFTLSGKAFVPKPEVDVGVVHFVPRVKPTIDMDFGLVEKVVRTVFGTRQKFISKGVGKLFPERLRTRLATEVFHATELDPCMRAFQLTVEEFGRICRAYKDICDGNPSLYDYNHRGPKTERELPWHEEEEEEDTAEEEEEEEEKKKKTESQLLE